MIRATAVSAVDQAILSALNLLLAVALIRYASKEEYGLYVQLFNLQSFFSPVHAGIFASAFLAIASRMDVARQGAYASRMAQAEIILTIPSAVVAGILCYFGARLFGTDLPVATCAAFAFALLGLWWREFVRQSQFAAHAFTGALVVDCVYVVVSFAGVAIAAATQQLSSQATFLCMAIGAAIATGTPQWQAFRRTILNREAIAADLLSSWTIGKWEILGSIATWAYAQSYVYFAALQGGLEAAAEIAAGRLIATPLALMWASYGNVLRPNVSRLLAANLYRDSRKLALRSALFVVVLSAIYAALVFAAIPFLNQSLFAGRFSHLRSLSLFWILYTALTGLSTVASSVLRSAMEFRPVFTRYLVSCGAAIVLLGIGMQVGIIEALVVALCLVEALSAVLFWVRMESTLRQSQG